MKLLVQRPALLGVLAVTILLFECVGTPMPIPPSVTQFNEEHLAVVVDEEGCEMAPDECLCVTGAAGSTEPFAKVFMHTLVSEDPMELVEMDTISDANGAFELYLVGPFDGVFRAIIHGAEASKVVNLRAEVGEPEPWPVVTVDESQIDSCLDLSTDVLDFGDVAVGSTSTQIVNATNICDERLSSFGAYIVPFFESVEGDFGAMAPFDDLDPGESTGLVVAFWPEDDRDHVGVLMVEMMPIVGLETIRMSLPVRGRAVVR